MLRAAVAPTPMPPVPTPQRRSGGKKRLEPQSDVLCADPFLAFVTHQLHSLPPGGSSWDADMFFTRKGPICRPSTQSHKERDAVCPIGPQARPQRDLFLIPQWPLVAPRVPVLHVTSLYPSRIPGPSGPDPTALTSLLQLPRPRIPSLGSRITPGPPGTPNGISSSFMEMKQCCLEGPGQCGLGKWFSIQRPADIGCCILVLSLLAV